MPDTTTIDLEQPLADALTAVAAVDNTPPSQLAALILADWLETHRQRFADAARALNRLAGIPIPTVDWDRATADPEVGEREQLLHVGMTADGTQFVEAMTRAANTLADTTSAIDALALDHTCDGCGEQVEDYEEWQSADGRRGHRLCVDPLPTDAPDDAPAEMPALNCGHPGCNFIGTSPQSLGGHRSAAHRGKPKAPAPRAHAPSTDGCAICGHDDAPKIMDGERLCRRCWTDAR